MGGRSRSAGEAVALGEQVWLRLPGGRYSVCAAPAPRRSCLVELAFSFLLSHFFSPLPLLPLPKTALPLRSVQTPRAGDLTYVSSSRYPILQNAGFALRHLKLQEAKGSVNCWVWVKRFTEGSMPSPTHNCALPSLLQLRGEDRLGSAALPHSQYSLVFSSYHTR